jgi:hypothetical protein
MPELSPWDEPEQATPWRPEDGPEPESLRYRHGHRPALHVLVDRRWRLMIVDTRDTYADGRVAYHGDMHLPYPTDRRIVMTYRRAYWWPQPGRLRIAHGPT